MQTARSSSRSFALCSAFATCLCLAACGDDGADGLEKCPDYKIQSDKYGVWHCTPRAGAGGGAAGSTPRGGAGAGGNPGSNSQQPGGPKPAAGSGGIAANSGGAPAPSVPPIPKGGIWTCVQVGSTCSCAMTDTAVDSCMKPPPGCCMMVRDTKNRDKYSGCVCYSETGVECSGAKQDPTNFVPVSSCPPT